ncbi:MAG: helix-turn-helix domain-containing protein [Bacteroidota bacterium]
MPVIHNLTSILTFALIAMGYFAGGLLFLKKENREANRYLGFLSILLATWLVDTLFRVTGIYGERPDLYFLPIYFSFGFGPLILFYTRSLTEQSHKLELKELVHFIPMLLQCSLYVFLQTQTYNYRRDFWLEVHKPYTYNIELALSFISLGVYLIFSRNHLILYKGNIENSFSNTHAIALKWLNRFHLVLFFVSFFWMLETATRSIFDFYAATPFSAITIGVVILLIAVDALLQQNLSSVKADFQLTAGKPESITLSEEERLSLAEIQKGMETNKYYLQPELSLKDFSKKLHKPTKEVSKLINMGLKKSFIEFVNQYRIDHFKELIKANSAKRYSLLGIAYESGFNSKSTFHRVFRQQEGMSPMDYVNNSAKSELTLSKT